MPKVTTVTPDCIEQFLSSLYVKGRAGNTLKAYGTDLRLLLADRGETPVENFELTAMLWLTENKDILSAKTTSRRLTSIRAFARWAQIPTPELAEYSGPSAAQALPHPLPEGIDGVRRLIAVARQPHHRAYIALCGLAGLRNGEALAAVASDFDLREMWLKVRGKGDVEREVPISDEAWDSIATPLVKSYGRGTVVGLHDRYARRLVTELGVRAGLMRPISSHDLRGTFATATMNKTGNIKLVQALLGHASIQTTQIYIGAAKAQLREAVSF